MSFNTHDISLNKDPSTLSRGLLFLNQLPSEVRRVLAQPPDMDLNLAKTADGIIGADLNAAISIASASDESTHRIQI